MTRARLGTASALLVFGATIPALAAFGHAVVALGILGTAAAALATNALRRERTSPARPGNSPEDATPLQGLRAPAALVREERIVAVNTAFSEQARSLGLDIATPTALGDVLDAHAQEVLRELAERNRGGHHYPPRVLRWNRPKAPVGASLLAVALDNDAILLLISVETVPDPRERDPALAPLVARLEQAVFQTDVGGALHYLSAGWQRLTGFAPEDQLGQSLVSHLHPGDREDAQRTLSLVEGGRKDHLLMEVRLLAGDGTLHWVELRANSLVGADGTARGAVGTITEVTRRKQLEESLRSSRRRLNTLLANVPGMVYRGRHDRNWTMEFVSDGCLELTGYEPLDIVDNGRVSFGDLIHPDDREFVWALVDTQLAQAKSFQLSYRIVDAAGELKWVWEQGRGIFSSSGELLALEGFITDVSARRGAEEQAKRRLWFDARTGLASRAIFDDRLAFVLEHGRLVGYRCAVLWVDLDNFGEINARFGREFGDRVLAGMARRFKIVQGPGSTVARVGGDEFALLVTDFRLAGAASPLPSGRELVEAVGRLAETLAQALAAPLRLDGRTLPVSASIGAAIRAETHVSGDALLAAARRAAQEARAEGTGHWRMAED